MDFDAKRCVETEMFPHGMDHNLMSPHNLGFRGKERNIVPNAREGIKEKKMSNGGHDKFPCHIYYNPFLRRL